MLANAEWDWETRLNCHHLAARLARENQVLFVDTVGGRTPAPREFKKIARRLHRIAGGVRKINDGLTILAPFVIPIYNSEWIRKLNTALLARQIRAARARARGERSRTNAQPILWIFLPSLVGIVGQFDEKLVIYHCVDEHAANPNVPAAQVIEWERRLLQATDVVFTTSSTLYDAKRVFNANTFYLPNVADTPRFSQARDSRLSVADDLNDLPHPIAGYIGNISSYKMDFDLLCAVAERNPGWSFVLVGPVGRGDPATDVSRLYLKNVFLLGPRPYAELPRYVKGFDACIIPFNQNESTRGSLPMKFFEYLAAGKPVVATDLPTLAEFREYFYPVHGVGEFSAALQAALNEEPSRAAARMSIAQKYSWDARMVEIEKIVQDALMRKKRPMPLEHRDVSASPRARVSTPTSLRAQRIAKRLFDVVIAAALLVIFSPLLLLIAIAIRISSGSPVLFKWQVVGKDGRPFEGYKFRTMVVNAEQMKQELVSRNEMRGPVFKMKDDPRVTRIGRLVRKFSLDEFPQLWSVLKGDMSLVGPRPPLQSEYEKFGDWQKRKLAVKPGMTSLWHVSGKPSDFDEWLRLDFEYIDHWSLWLDFKILFKTGFLVLAGKNY